MNPETITIDDYRRLTSGKRGAKSARAVAVPRAADAERTGLTPLLVAGWSLWYSGERKAWQLYVGTLAAMQHSTGWHAELKDACTEAKRIRKEHGL